MKLCVLLRSFAVGILSVISICPSLSQFTQQGNKLVGTGAVLAAQQGTGVALSGDGNTAFVGGPYDNFQRGATWVYARTGATWTQQGSKLTNLYLAGPPVGPPFQGYTVTLSADGNTGAIGAIGGGTDGEVPTGGVMIYTDSGGVWTLQPGTTPSGITFEPCLGDAIALSDDGNTALGGGPCDGTHVGAAFVWTRSGGVWTQQARLVGTGTVGQSGHGSSVSLSADGNTAIVGGPRDNTNVGAVWIYTRSGTVWTQQGSKLVGTGAVGAARQGTSVSLSADGNTAMVGGGSDNTNVGAVWVFIRSAGVWSQQGSKLVGTGAVGASTQGEVDLSADGNTAVVGGPGDNSLTGAAWIFTRSGGTWSQHGDKLVGTSAVGQSRQGTSVSISSDGNTVILGGRSDSSLTGAAWVFHSTRMATITAISDVPNDQGGEVLVTWDRSAFDFSSASPQVESYSIWRKSPSASIGAAIASSRPGSILMDSSIVGFDSVTSIPSDYSPSYQAAVPTLDDSSASGVPYFQFVVVAHTSDTDYFYVSEVDSGYSADNLSPIPPTGLIATVDSSAHVNLSWTPPPDTDVSHFQVYRSTTSPFTPDAEHLIGTSDTVGFLDTAVVVDEVNYYRIVAVDVHDNESAPSEEVDASVLIESQFSVDEEWNIISLPLTMSDYAMAVLFPDAGSPASTYENGYVAYGTLKHGIGYWVRFTGGAVISHSGLVRTKDTVDVEPGWVMIGSLTSPIPVSTIESIPGGIVTSKFYGYDGGYHAHSTLEPGKGYWVKVSQSGKLVMSSAGPVNAGSRIRIEDTGELPPSPPNETAPIIPKSFSLEQNYPNPFNPVTRINYAIPSSAYVRLSIFNLLGQEIAILVDGVQDPGNKSVTYDASATPSGVYTYRLRAGEFTAVRKLLLIK